MRLRDHEGVKGKRDSYPFDPRLLKVDQTYNVRDLTSSAAKAKLAELKEQIRGAGVRTPLEVRIDGDDVVIVSGHRRHRAVMELIAEGEPIETVLVIQEPLGTSDAERTLNLALHNSGDPLRPIEVAAIVKRLKDFGWDDGQIQKRMGWKSRASVTQHLDMLAMPAELQAAVKRNSISASQARKSVADIGATETLKMIEANEAQGKKTRPRDLPAKPKTAKAPAKSEPEPEPPPPEPAPQPEPQAPEPQGEAPNPELTEAAMALNNAILATMPPPEHGEPPAEAVVVTEVAIPQRQTNLNGFFRALAPVREALNTVELSEFADDEVVRFELMGVDAKRASAALNQAMGE